jgi:hypothetical protein
MQCNGRGGQNEAYPDRSLLSAEEEGRGFWVTYQCSILSDQRLDYVPARLKDEGGIDE